MFPAPLTGYCPDYLDHVAFDRYKHVVAVMGTWEYIATVDSFTLSLSLMLLLLLLL